ncbi:MAG TPA: hypothetical protein VKP11_11685 [Frankiaceae bacterium]|nr:hypothetical protein [Frankiaceae bacterium]
MPPPPPPARDVWAAPAGPADTVGAPPPAPAGPLVTGGEIVAGLVSFAVTAAAGAPLGLLWAAVSPRLDVAAALAGSETAFTAQVAADIRFGLLSAVFGLVAGLVAWWRGRRGGWPVPLALATGGLSGALLAGWVGHLRRSHEVLSRLPPRANDLAVQLVDFKVRAHGLYVAYPLVALAVFAALTWLTGRGERPPAASPPAERWWSAAR